MSEFVRLRADEAFSGRPFTDPSRASRDCEILIGLIGDLHAAAMGQPPPSRSGPGRDRLIVTRTGRANLDSAVAVVGFFGERNPAAPPEVVAGVEAVNAEMIAEFAAFPALYGYVSRLLDDGLNYANLVVLAGVDGIGNWRDLPGHIAAADELAPRFYRSVRIYNGALPRGIRYGADLQMRVVKFWDYGSDPCWRAERVLGSGAPEATT